MTCPLLSRRVPAPASYPAPQPRGAALAAWYFAGLALLAAACGEKKDDDGSENQPVGSQSATTGPAPSPLLSSSPGSNSAAASASAPVSASPSAPASSLPAAASSTPGSASVSASAPALSNSATASASGGAGGTGAGGTGGDAPAASGTAGSGGAGGSSGGAGGEGSAGEGGAGGGTPGEFTLTVGTLTSHNNDECSKDSCAPCEPFPPQNISVCQNPDESPAMSWTAGPEGTTGYALLLIDTSNDLTHWALWNIPLEVTSLPAALPAGELTGELEGATQAGFQQAEYAGSGACLHVYEFRLYAVTEAPTGNDASAIRTALEASTDPTSFVRLRSDCPEGCTNPFPGSDCTP